MPMTRSILLLIFALFFAAGTWAEEKLEEFKVDKAEEAKIPPGIDVYKGRKVAQTMHYTGAPWLVRESREREEECSTLLKVLDIKPGQVICDMGSGNGYYTIKLAKLAGETGKIYAVDIQPEMLYLLRKHAKE